MQNLFSTVLIALTVLTPVIAMAGSTSDVAVQIDEAGGVIVAVTVNGSGPFPFLLDTGATHSVISGRLADRLALRFVAKTSVRTSTGEEWRPVVEIDQTAIGAIRSERLLASVAPSAQLDSIARGIDGIIGQDFLFSLHYTLDYRGKRLTWNDRSADDESSTRVTLVPSGGRYLVEAFLPGGKTPMLLVPDSGASGFVMYDPHQFADTRASGLIPVRSLSGTGDAGTMTMREIRVGSATLSNQRVAVLHHTPDVAIEGHGLMPLHLFSSVTFNPSEGYLTLRGVSGR